MSAAREPAPEPHSFAAQVDGGWVVLDVRADRYFLAVPRTGASVATDDDALASLGAGRDSYAAGWSAGGSTWASGPAQPLPGLAALACVHRVSKLLARGPFEALVEAIRATPCAAHRNRPAPETLLASYEAARPLHPKARICRLDAPAICLLMRQYGHPARLMFGARLEPFAAHCWAELEGMVLNEPVETVAQFRPILSV
jgi:hypothetical protein